MTARAPTMGAERSGVEQWRRGVPIGEVLAGARHRAGLTVIEVSRQTRIRQTVITRIEDDDFSACGGDFYARGNIRSIAQVVGADPEPLIHEYDEVHRAPGVLSAVSLEELLRPAQTSGRRRLNWTAALGLALLVALGFVGYHFLLGSPRAAGAPPAASIPPAAANHVATHSGQSGMLRAPKTSRAAALYVHHPATAAARAPTGPAATVRAYVAAINDHRYARAWRLGGQHTDASYSDFVSGFSTTARDTLAIVSVSGDVVTARLTAQQTDGTVSYYQGTYTVDHGVIVGSDVVQVG